MVAAAAASAAAVAIVTAATLSFSAVKMVAAAAAAAAAACDLQQAVPNGVLGSLHDLGLHALRKPGGAHNASAGRRHHEWLQCLCAKLLLL